MTPKDLSTPKTSALPLHHRIEWVLGIILELHSTSLWVFNGSLLGTFTNTPQKRKNHLAFASWTCQCRETMATFSFGASVAPGPLAIHTFLLDRRTNHGFESCKQHHPNRHQTASAGQICRNGLCCHRCVKQHLWLVSWHHLKIKVCSLDQVVKKPNLTSVSSFSDYNKWHIPRRTHLFFGHNPMFFQHQLSHSKPAAQYRRNIMASQPTPQ